MSPENRIERVPLSSRTNDEPSMCPEGARLAFRPAAGDQGWSKGTE